MDYKQRTLKYSVGCTGIGLHSGEKIKLTIRPAQINTGIRFVRRDLPGFPSVKVCSNNVIDTTLATTIASNGCRVATIEHLMAAFFGLGIDNAIVELDGPEVPIMDGSAAPFLFLIKDGGIKEQDGQKQFIIIKKAFSIKDGNRSISIYPSKKFQISYMIDFQHPMLKNQEYRLNFSTGAFARDISKARTFGFLKDVQILKDNGFAKGGSLDNAIVIDEFKVLNEDGLRFEDEFVRHKILDFIGDIAVMGAPIIGRFVVKRSGHSLNHFMLRKLITSKRHWKTITLKNQTEPTRNSIEIPTIGLQDPVPA